MHIDKIEFELVDLELTKPYSISYKTVDSVSNLVVRVIDKNGKVGWGASNPSKYVVGESVEEAYEHLSQADLSSWKGLNPLAYGALMEKNEAQFGGHPGVRAALDIALHDLMAKKLGIPLHQFFGISQQPIATSVTIGIMGIEESIDQAQEYLMDGFRHIKVKLGENLEVDLERMIKLHEKFGADVAFRIDANQGWTYQELLEFFNKTQQLGLELIEQPLPVVDSEEQRKLPEMIRKKLAADESLVSPEDAIRLAEEPRPFGIYNIKIMKSGGLYAGHQIAKIAKLRKIPLMWGCNDESIISISGSLHLALAMSNTKFLDLDGSLDLARDVVKGGFSLSDGKLIPLDRPGLGIEPN